MQLDFRIRQFNEPWQKVKGTIRAKEYVKLHAAIDMQWRAIISFHFTRTHVHEITQLEILLEPLWDLGNVYADSGYLSSENCPTHCQKGRDSIYPTEMHLCWMETRETRSDMEILTTT